MSAEQHSQVNNIIIIIKWVHEMNKQLNMGGWTATYVQICKQDLQIWFATLKTNRKQIMCMLLIFSTHLNACIYPPILCLQLHRSLNFHKSPRLPLQLPQQLILTDTIYIYADGVFIKIKTEREYWLIHHTNYWH